MGEEEPIKPALWPEVESQRCEGCKKKGYDVINRLNIKGVPQLCASCFEKRLSDVRS